MSRAIVRLPIGKTTHDGASARVRVDSPLDTARPPYRAAAVAGLGLLALYALTLAPTTAFWDASEYIATAYILGIPHPPGNPLFVVLGRVWILLLEPTGWSVAIRMNLFAAVTSAGAGALWFLVAHRLLVPVLRSHRAALVGAGAAVLVAGTAFTVWNQSTVNEKVYTLSVLIIALASWLALRWRDRAEEPGAERALLGSVYALALGSTNHLMSVLPLPALALFVVAVRPGALRSTRLWLRGGLLVLLGLSFNFFLPIRAAQEPVINEGHPTCESAAGAVVAVYSLGRTGCPELAYNLARGQYQKPPLTERQAPFRHQLLNWYQYFEWQWARGADASDQPGSAARVPFALLFGMLGLAGLWAVWRTDRHAALFLGTLALTLTVGLVYYLNFRYGYSLAPEIDDLRLHEVRERDYFFVAGFGLWGVLAGLGLAWCWAVVAERVAPARTGATGRGHRGLVLTSPILVLALVPLALNARWASRAGDWAARDWAWNLLASVEPYGVLFTNGDNDTFPLWYLQEVEGLRQDVTVIVGQYLFTDWYPKQLRDLTRPDRQRPFRPDDVGGLYRVADVPGRAVTELTDAQLDSVVGGSLPEDQTVPFGGVALTFPRGMALNRSHRVALAIIRDALDERPVYFSGPGGMLNELGLRPFGVRHGLVVKLDMRSRERADADAELVQGSPAYGGERFDLERSLRLYDEVYHLRSVKDRDVWTDRATLNIPWYYYALALQLSDVARLVERPADLVERLEADAAEFSVTAQGGRSGTP
jgi:hypothetical protein